jgi:hypothetical protein
MNTTRFAYISTTDADSVRAYLPANYSVIREASGVFVGGIDRAGWTLDGYVLPRLASGLMFGAEVAASDVLREALRNV